MDYILIVFEYLFSESINFGVLYYFVVMYLVIIFFCFESEDDNF